jgi:4-hydroxy-2-oxoheptanedioate aldolase
MHALNFHTTPDDYYAHANDEVLVVLQCEHIQAVEDADAIFSVPGIDAIFVGPYDLAASMRDKDGQPPAAEATARVMAHVLEKCRKHHVAPGLHCGNAEEARKRIAEGWQLVAVGSELRMMLDGAKDAVRHLGLTPKQGEVAKY